MKLHCVICDGTATSPPPPDKTRPDQIRHKLRLVGPVRIKQKRTPGYSLSHSHGVQVVHADAITTGEYKVTKFFSDNQCVGAPVAIGFEPIVGRYSLQDCPSMVDGTCQYAGRQVYGKESCTDDLPLLMRTEYPDMKVIQEQKYKDGTCRTLQVITIAPAKADFETHGTCKDGLTSYLIDTDPDAAQKEADKKCMYIIIGSVCGGVVLLSLSGYLGRKYCCLHKKQPENEAAGVKPQAQSYVVQPVKTLELQTVG